MVAMQLNTPAAALLRGVCVWQASRPHTLHSRAWQALGRLRRPSQTQAIVLPCTFTPIFRCHSTRSSSSSTVSASAAAQPSASTSGLVLYNTLSRQKEVFTARPDQGNRISMYVCGVTVYDFSHIGHARVYVAFDVLYRYLRHLGYDVTYVRNFTDVDDKIIARAAEAGEDPLELSRRFISEFHADMRTLNCLDPTLEPLATDHIGDMLTAIERIIEHGHAYAIDGDVYFDVASLPGYGKLSGRAQEDNRAGERVAVDERKRGPADFALWKSAKPGEPTWDSPWGPGRPGWHIECSAMINALLGEVVDIHGGGRDLVFPHHENELAQARAAAAPCGCGSDAHSHSHSHGDGSENAFVRYWVHNGFVNVDAEKMSKSLGNFFTIREVLQQYHPCAMRWFLVGTQYRQGINYTQRALEEASDRVYYLYQAVADAEEVLEGENSGVLLTATVVDEGSPGDEMLLEVHAALADDLNTPLAVAALSAPLKTLNDLLHTKKGRKQADRVAVLSSYHAALRSALSLLGLWPENIKECLSEMRTLALVRSGLTEEQVAAAIEERAAARAAKNFGAADAVRERLEKVGIMFMDTPQGTSWKPGPRLHIAEDEAAAEAVGAPSNS